MIPNDMIQRLRTVGKERLFFFINHILYNLVLFIVAIIAAKIAGPEKWGLITLLMLVATYSGFLTLGINNGMGIALPLAIGKNDNSNIKKIKSTAVIINTARGNIVDENDLNDALNNNLIAGAAIDVFSKEPAKENLLFNNPKVILTPHVAASTTEAQIIVAKMIAQQKSDYLISGKILNNI